MTKEDIITTAIHEAFLCGKEAGEAYERAYHIMQKKVEEARHGKVDIDNMALYDGFLPQVELTKLKEENEKLGKILEEKDATITELRSQLEEYKDCSQEHFRKEIAERDNIISEQDAELADLHRQYDELYATVNPLAIGPNRQAAPAEPSHYSEGDQVLVSGSFFKDVDSHTYHATILEVKRGLALVLITEKDSDFENDEHYVPYEYITKQ